MPFPWSYFDTWLEQALELPELESYHFSHFAELTDFLIDYGDRNRFWSRLPRNSPLEWRAVYFVFDELVYPWYGSMGEVHWHCRMSAYQGRTAAILGCRELALAENWKTADQDGQEMDCTDLLRLGDKDLADVLGHFDPMIFECDERDPRHPSNWVRGD